MASDSVVEINGNRYVVRQPVQHFDLPVQTQAFRTTGDVLRTNNPKLSSYVINDWSGGFGTTFIRPGQPDDLKGFFDAEVNTMWRQGIVLPLEPQDITEPGTNYQVTCSCIFGGATWAGFTPTTSAGGQYPLARNFSGTAWQGGGNIITNYTAWLYDMIAAGDRMYCIFGIDSNDHVLRYSTDGVSWTAPATTPVSLNLLSDHERHDGALLAWDGTNVVVALKDDVGGQIDIQVSTDGGDTWGNPAGGAISVASGGGPNGLQTYLDTDGSTVIYLGTEEGVWLIDLAAGAVELILAMPVAIENCRSMAVHNGSLYVPVDHLSFGVFGMKKITITGTGRLITDVGLDVKQGIPADMRGRIHWMRSIGPWLFACTRPDIGTNARIIVLTGIPGEGWQHVYKFGTTLDPISWFEGAGNDLLFQQGGFGLSDAGDTTRLDNLFLPPNSGGTFVYATPANFELPELGGDVPEETGAFMQVALDAQNLDSDDSEYVDFEWGLDGTAPSEPSTDVRFDSANQIRNLGTSSRGLAARTIRPNLELVTGDTSVTPLVRELVVLSRKKGEDLRGFILDIDIPMTLRMRRTSSPGGILDELRTIKRSNILVSFQEDESEGERQVEMTSMDRLDFTRGPGRGEELGQVEGLIRITLEEVLEQA